MQEGFEKTPYKKKAVRGKVPVYYERLNARDGKKVWGRYENRRAAEQACKSLKKKYKWWEFSLE